MGYQPYGPGMSHLFGSGAEFCPTYLQTLSYVPQSNSQSIKCSMVCFVGLLKRMTKHLLLNLFVCISFKWNVSKLGYLEQTITTVLGYPTSVRACVVTDAPVKLERVFDSWRLKHLSLCEEHSTDVEDRHPYALVWRHREIIATAAKRVLRHSCQAPNPGSCIT